MSSNYFQTISQNLSHLKSITVPFADSAEHVQGPGGNTSFKNNDVMLIKSSGHTFKNVVCDAGIVLLSVPEVIEKISSKKSVTGETDTQVLPRVLSSLPDTPGQKPSMEYEFHALLSNYVLHTHSVYANILNCSFELPSLLASSLSGLNYLVVPYVTPGFPIASFLYDYKNENGVIPEIIFLQNHGIIVHDNDEHTVIDNYKRVEQQIKQAFKINGFYNAEVTRESEGTYSIAAASIYGDFDFANALDNLENKILIPDQAIFFKGKIGVMNQDTPIIIDSFNKKIIIKGNPKFAEACADMIQAIQFIKTYQGKLSLTPVYLLPEEINILYDLPAEKHRIDLLKN